MPLAGLYITICVTREMENISRGPTFGDFVTIRTEGSMQDIIHSYKTTEYKSTDSPLLLLYRNVLREILSVDRKKESLM
jgi:hypothetical protein